MNKKNTIVVRKNLKDINYLRKLNKLSDEEREIILTESRYLFDKNLFKCKYKYFKLPSTNKIRTDGQTQDVNDWFDSWTKYHTTNFNSMKIIKDKVNKWVKENNLFHISYYYDWDWCEAQGYTKLDDKEILAIVISHIEKQAEIKKRKMQEMRKKLQKEKNLKLIQEKMKNIANSGLSELEAIRSIKKLVNQFQ